VFDLITTTMLNKELTGYMPGLSAKVFRTFNASITLERELANLDISTTPQEKLVEYNRANREVAILCNHQRTVPKGFQEQFDKMQSKVRMLFGIGPLRVSHDFAVSVPSLRRSKCNLWSWMR
jgi:DNA topoisomerase I